MRNRPDCPLTGKQREVLAHIARGLTYQQTAQAMGVTASTVRSHIHRALVELGVPTSMIAVLVCVQHGWIDGTVDFEPPAPPPEPPVQPPATATDLYLDAFIEHLHDRTADSERRLELAIEVLAHGRGKPLPDRNAGADRLDAFYDRLATGLTRARDAT